jgi:hypothetical protein
MKVSNLDSDVLARARRKHREMMLAQRLCSRVIDAVLDQLGLHHANVVDAACRLLDVEATELASKMKLVLDDPENRRLRELLAMVIPTASKGADETELDTHILWWCQLQAPLLRYKAMTMLVYQQGAKDDISAEQEVEIEEWLHTPQSAPVWALRNLPWTT